MIWESWSDFFAMGGYARYVWGSLIVVLACMAGEIVLVRARLRAISAQIGAELRAERTRRERGGR